MASFFEAEKDVPENRRRQNFVFMAYPFTPALPAADYRAAVRALQSELPVRFWYFLDETTTAELMRKIWRAILRADLAVFDISDGNPNVAFELGLAVANGRPSGTFAGLDPTDGAGPRRNGWMSEASDTCRKCTSSSEK
jgi:nucleoside 2-deoxyribosyltransferase